MNWIHNFTRRMHLTYFKTLISSFVGIVICGINWNAPTNNKLDYVRQCLNLQSPLLVLTKSLGAISWFSWIRMTNRTNEFRNCESFPNHLFLIHSWPIPGHRPRERERKSPVLLHFSGLDSGTTTNNGQEDSRGRAVPERLSGCWLSIPFIAWTSVCGLWIVRTSVAVVSQSFLVTNRPTLLQRSLSLALHSLWSQVNRHYYQN